MPKRLVSIPRAPQRWDLEIVSHGRRGPSDSIRLTPAQIEQVARTVRRTPEVVVKVSGGARDPGGAKAHFDYIDRHGKLELETDDGRALQGKHVGAELVEDWNLDLSEGQYRAKPSAGERDRRPKLVHNIVLSMPVHTPPDKLLAAAKEFAREHFALQHRYAMALHTDLGHPHVHLVVKAEHEFEPGKRLHIKKATLRQWREDFAAAMRAQGVAANATPAPERGHVVTTKKDAIHHRLRAAARSHDEQSAQAEAASKPKDSTFMRAKVEAVATALKEGRFDPGPGKQRLLATTRSAPGFPCPHTGSDPADAGGFAGTRQRADGHRRGPHGRRANARGSRPSGRRRP